MELDNNSKINILMMLMQENRKQVEWVKNLDYKIVYYTIVLLIAEIAWLGSKPASAPPIWLFCFTTLAVSLLAIIFLARNHTRHFILNKEYYLILNALSLTDKNMYGPQIICPADKGSNIAFHAGRGIYALLIILGAIITILIVRNLCS